MKWKFREVKAFFISKVFGVVLRKNVHVNFEIYEVCFAKQNFFHAQSRFHNCFLLLFIIVSFLYVINVNYLNLCER